jgi:lipopolysaccharide assembly protein A
MFYVNLLLRTALFLIMLGLAVKNDQPITLHYFFGYEWQSSLVIVLLIAFAFGAAVGLLSMFSRVLKYRREITRLKRDFSLQNKLADTSEE